MTTRQPPRRSVSFNALRYIKLVQIAQAKGLTMSQIVSEWIDRDHSELGLQEPTQEAVMSAEDQASPEVAPVGGSVEAAAPPSAPRARATKPKPNYKAARGSPAPADVGPTSVNSSHFTF